MKKREPVEGPLKPLCSATESEQAGGLADESRHSASGGWDDSYALNAIEGALQAAEANFRDGNYAWCYGNIIQAQNALKAFKREG